LPLPDLPAYLGRVRELTTQYQAGAPEGFDAFRELADLILRITILAGHGGVRLAQGPRPNTLVLGGWNGPTDPLPLVNDRYLRVAVTFVRGRVEEGHRIKVVESSYQYQVDPEGRDWVFRYDFLRHPPDPHPASHLQINGEAPPEYLPPGVSLARIHFPTDRVSLEAVIRLLVDQFAVPTNEETEVWRSVLAESEAPFLGIRHRSLSGPAG